MTYRELLELRMEINKQLEPVINAIADYEGGVFDTLQKGGEVAGFKLKKGRKSRKVVDESKLVQRLLGKGVSKADIYDVKIKGVSALDKLINAEFDKDEAKEVYGRFIEETEGKPSLQYTGE
ncbi:protein of unknown function DUF2800 [Vibrio phage 1.238.A._10N.261.52.F10]|uniref:Coil containing protein n=1 Tax=Vibrio phage 1.238.A._10N.261.52.F10 TaxID=1881231 RepID=A0A2I7RUF6_9CAUD|nr:protein of unknown function DUF2800 [Vibrio phage 1.238.A._10N.261.52.F10]AUR97296.1 protein of unknown function DUF2800 [Vibrio phage 1.238.A._10N.261.52.F10]AUR97390.1 protein of unknown function DUF2800 [Vibrio phage 1.238.B._10N.261.52.F10]